MQMVEEDCSKLGDCMYSHCYTKIVTLHFFFQNKRFTLFTIVYIFYLIYNSITNLFTLETVIQPNDTHNLYIISTWN